MRENLGFQQLLWDGLLSVAADLDVFKVLFSVIIAIKSVAKNS